MKNAKLSLGDSSLEEQEKFLKEVEKGNSPEEVKEHNSSKDNGKGKTAAKAKKELPDVDKIKIGKIDGKKVEEEYQKKKSHAEKAGKKLVNIREEISQIKQDKRLAYSSILQERLDKLEEIEETLLTEDESLRGHVEFSVFLERIRETTASKQSVGQKVDALIAEAIERGKIKEVKPPAEGSRPSYLLYWRSSVYQARPDPETGEVLPATIAVFKELKKLIKAEKNRYWREKNEQIKKMKENPPIAEILKEEESKGVYFGYLPQKENLSSVYFTVETDGKVIRPVEATGPLWRFFQRIAKSQAFVTIDSLKEGKLIVKVRLSEERFRDLLKFYKILRVATLRKENSTS